MATEKRLIDANKISYHKSGFPKGEGFDSGLDWAFREDIDKLHTVDAVEVVRCGECQYAKPYERADGKTGYYCQHPKNTFQYGTNWERLFEPVKESDDFCSYGVRRRKDG